MSFWPWLKFHLSRSLKQSAKQIQRLVDWPSWRKRQLRLTNLDTLASLLWWKVIFIHFVFCSRRSQELKTFCDYGKIKHYLYIPHNNNVSRILRQFDPFLGHFDPGSRSGPTAARFGSILTLEFLECRLFSAPQIKAWPEPSRMRTTHFTFTSSYQVIHTIISSKLVEKKLNGLYLARSMKERRCNKRRNVRLCML